MKRKEEKRRQEACMEEKFEKEAKLSWVEFEAFKDHFADLPTRSTDGDGGSLRPVVADEVEPKFVKDGKRYGRRSRPDTTPSRPCGFNVRPFARLDGAESRKRSDEEPPSPEGGAALRFQCRAPEPDEEDGPTGRPPGAEEQVAPTHLQNLLCGCCSTPLRKTAPEDGSTAAVLSRLDDGSGRAGPERVVALWADEGVRDGRDILETLDFPAEERLSLCELTSALDNELVVGGNRIHRAALICYKDEIRHLRARAEQACGERDKAKADLERAERRNLRLLREADERHAGMEELNRTRLRELERDFRARLTAQRDRAEQDAAAASQQLEQERQKLQQQLRTLGAREAGLQEELGAAVQEKRRLDEELAVVKRRLTEAESGARRLRADFDQLLQHKPGSSDGEDRAARLLRDCEGRCRELRDRNDELICELELLRSREKRDRKPAPSDSGGGDAPRTGPAISRDDPMNGDVAGDYDTSTAVSIETEFALEKLKRRHERESRRLRVQMRTQVENYERTLDRMRRSAEAEREDVARAFKEQHEKAAAAQELEAELEACRKVLHETARRLRGKTADKAESGAVLKELYVENARLMKTLQLSERRHGDARDRNVLLEAKVRQLNRLLADVVSAALRP
ncbi:ninein-like protein isoform X2 [Syngnathoides biaculeatus]|uniref:ninein-like protein isoform X2 n=1 Tax=Syngnathoides biaculeatus TaxID=300417 RepID=UPI002ADE7704|nr:ninein-like protein isoform X2 [Syngnathoides biaculeatus]